MAQYVVVVRALETGFCDRIDPRLEKARQRYERKREVRRHLALIPVHVGNRSAHRIELVVQLHLGVPGLEAKERRKSEAGPTEESVVSMNVRGLITIPSRTVETISSSGA